MSNTTTIKSEKSYITGRQRYVATAFIRDSGATTMLRVHRCIFGKLRERMDRYGNVFVGYGSPNIETPRVVFIIAACRLL